MIVADPTAYVPEHVFTIDLSKIMWRATGSLLEGADSRARLSAVVQIGGADHHLEAIEVSVIDGYQCGADGVEDVFEQIANDLADDERFETVAIEGRSYVLSMRPFTRSTA